jgi:hypothetical protein
VLQASRVRVPIASFGTDRPELSEYQKHQCAQTNIGEVFDPESAKTLREPNDLSASYV